MSDTPKTDALIRQCAARGCDDPYRYIDMREHARDLERSIHKVAYHAWNPSDNLEGRMLMIQDTLREAGVQNPHEVNNGRA